MRDFNMRYIARIVVEAATPTALGSGEKNLVTDRLIARDVSGLPYIPGTSLKGVLSHSILGEIPKKNATENWKDILGFQDKKDGSGSRLIVSSAHFFGAAEKVFEGVTQPDWNNEFYRAYQTLPVRDHVRINDLGAAEKGAKFDEEVVYKGTRFVFEMELIGKPEEKTDWETILNTLANQDFRIGGGTRKGFGELKIISVHRRDFDLTNKTDFFDYADKSSSLTVPVKDSVEFILKTDNCGTTTYLLSLKPDSFFLFGAGEGSEVADMIAASEHVVIWNGSVPTSLKDNLLIPASSVKGAIAHRVAFHFNKMKGLFAELFENKGMLVAKAMQEKYHLPTKFDSNSDHDIKKLLTVYNPAVIDLFGFSVASGDKGLVSLKGKAKGKTIISDVHKTASQRKVLNHVAIDRFTGGAIDGALFSEEVATLHNDDSVELKIVVSNKATKESLECLELALQDIANGMLPLGGGVMRGNGCFNGEILKNGNKL
jgi:CRISPR/Cas system CSM-associated protein Csm3 (group 7 of RAMP superfamily)